MLSLHHLTHAVCLAVISFLLKKHLELRWAHAQQTLDLQQLQLACRGAESHPRPPYPCSCPPSPPARDHTDPAMLPTDVKTQALSTGGQSSSQGSGLLSDSSVSREDPVDEFGRTSDRGVEVVYIEGSTSSASFHSLPLTHPAMHSSVSSSSDPVPQVSRDWASQQSARKLVDGRTETAQSSSISFHGTAESLEKIKPSPSSAGSFRTVESRDGTVFVTEGEGEEDDNNFYQGSRIRQHNQETEEDVIVTSISGSLKTDFSPQGVDLSFQSFNEDDDGEWEEEEEETSEEKPHPAFGNVRLDWLSDKEKENMVEEGSSIQCTGQSLSDRICRFRHLCFNPQTQQFVFLLSPHDVQDNISESPSHEALLEMSTVAGHNAQNFHYLTMSASSLSDFRVASVPGTTVVFKRFKPDNVMHAFHDDIFPLFHTLMALNIRLDAENRKFPVSLFLADENSEGEFYDLYDAFPTNGVFTLGSLIASVAKTSQSESLVCFPEAQLGLKKTTTWYQYGFFTPQGPIANSEVQSFHVHSAASYVLDRLAKDCPLCGDGGHLVLISRKETRRILNEMELVMAISKEFRVKVMTVSLETHTMADILPIIHSSLGIVGMHGSLLALAAFLRQGSVMIELFPHAVRPENYTPYATLSYVPGMLIAYRAWANQNADKSVTHPDWSADFGGIQHLPPQQQQEIMSQTEVPPHLCCEDASWLYHIFQDTHVDIPQVLSLLSSALQESAPLRAAVASPHPYPPSHKPGPPRDLRCSTEHDGSVALVLEWSPPWDVLGEGGVTEVMGVEFRMVLQELGPGEGVRVMEVGDRVRVTVREGVREGWEYRVWVWSGVEGVYGPFAAVVTCSTKL
ncbi:hypothetical protein ACOMHN_059299 [Nucella lapillus]